MWGLIAPHFWRKLHPNFGKMHPTFGAVRPRRKRNAPHQKELNLAFELKIIQSSHNHQLFGLIEKL